MSNHFFYAAMIASVMFLSITSGSQAQSLDLTSPDGGETYDIGDTMHIRWTAENVNDISLTFSPDGGQNFYAINQEGTLRTDDPGWGDYAWIIPETIQGSSGPVSVVSSQCIVKIQDYMSNAIQDQSSTSFTIGGVPGSISCEPQTLTFTGSGTQNVVIKGAADQSLSASEGASWLEVVIENSGDSAVAANTIDITRLPEGKHSAIVTVSAGDVSAKYTVTIHLGEPALSQIVIRPATQICTPGGTVSFSSELRDQFKALFEGSVVWSLPDGGGTINNEGVFTSSGTTGTYAVAARSDDIADTATVLVQEGALVLIAPKGGEVFFPGDTLKVRWSGDTERLTGVIPRISVDDGRTWHHIADRTIDPSSSQWGMYAWVIPDSVEGLSTLSKRCFVNVRDYSNETFSDISEAFEIRSRGPVIAFNPNLLVFTVGGSRQVSVTNEGSGDMPDLTVSTGAAWLALSVDNSPSQGATITATVNTSGLASGLYRAGVTASGPGVAGQSYAVELRFGEPVASRVMISPGVQPCEPGGSVKFTAAVFDQMGDPIAETVHWNVDSDAGTITPEGVFTSNGAPGRFTVGATPANTSISTSATVTVGFNELTLLSPVGGEVFQIGQEIAVEWSANPARFTGIVPMISLDRGKNWHSLGETVSPGDARWGSTRWTIPASLGGTSTISNACVVRIYEYDNRQIGEYSPSAFSIREPEVKPMESEGVTLQLGEKVSVAIPPEAVKAEDVGTSVQITQTRTTIAPPAGFQLENSGDIFLCTPHGLSFTDSITLSLPYDGDTNDVRILRRSDEAADQWEVIAGYWFDPAFPGVVFFKTTHFSVYAVSREYEQEQTGLRPVAVTPQRFTPSVRVHASAHGLSIAVRARGTWQGSILAPNGRRLASFNGCNNGVRFLRLPAGLYIVRVQAGERVLALQRVIVRR